MLNKITNTIGRLNMGQRPINILTFPTHEGYASSLGYLNSAVFHVYHIRDQKKWDFQTRGLPQNHILYMADVATLRSDVVFDCILAQERTVQLPVARQLQQMLQIPVINLTHTEPYPNLRGTALKRLQEQKGDVNLYITEHNKQSWDDTSGIVIPHGIDENVFKPETVKTLEGRGPARGVVIANHFEARDVFLGYNLYKEVNRTDPIDVIGDNPGTKLHRNINKAEDLVKALNYYDYYCNFTQLSPLPLSLLEAAMCGLPIITTAKQQIPSVFTHGVNALFAETPADFRKQIDYLKNKSEECLRLGSAARHLMIEKFSIGNFVTNWQQIFKEFIK